MGSLKRTLVKNYKVDRDYKIFPEKSDGGRPKEQILLSNDCFKRIAMQSQAKNSEQVRTYFIEMEDMWKELLQQQMEDRSNREKKSVTSIKLYERAPKTNFPIGHCVYVIKLFIWDETKQKEEIAHKIGRCKNLNKRFSKLWHTLEGNVEVIFYQMHPDHRFLENSVHSGLRKLEIGSEIFIAEPEKIIELIKYCVKMHDDMCKIVGTYASPEDAENDNRPFN